MYLPKSFTRYSVIVEGKIVRYFDTADDAIDFARTCVYLSPVRAFEMQNLLYSNRVAEWGYGFTSVAIYPPKQL